MDASAVVLLGQGAAATARDTQNTPDMSLGSAAPPPPLVDGRAVVGDEGRRRRGGGSACAWVHARLVRGPCLCHSPDDRLERLADQSQRRRDGALKRVALGVPVHLNP